MSTNSHGRVCQAHLLQTRHTRAKCTRRKTRDLTRCAQNSATKSVHRKEESKGRRAVHAPEFRSASRNSAEDFNNHQRTQPNKAALHVLYLQTSSGASVRAFKGGHWYSTDSNGEQTRQVHTRKRDLACRAPQQRTHRQKDRGTGNEDAQEFMNYRPSDKTRTSSPQTPMYTKTDR